MTLHVSKLPKSIVKKAMSQKWKTRQSAKSKVGKVKKSKVPKVQKHCFYK